jgi:hypothetical protein
MAIPQSLSAFNIADASVSLWVFRKSGPSDQPVFNGRWVQIEGALSAALKLAAISVRGSIVETNDYELLATIEVGQSLLIDTVETHADNIVVACAAELPQRRAQNIGHMSNTDFYVVKFTHQDRVLHTVTKTDSSWRSRRSQNYLTVVLKGEELSLEADPAFSISRKIDFFISGDEILILDRDNFESIVNYKAAHAEEFNALQNEAPFADLFVDLTPLVTFVGTNKLHLRRVCALRTKGLYADAQFMARLRQNYAQAGLDLSFDAQGRFVVNPDQCSDVIRALLDHRLHSLFSNNFYDVPNATVV